MVNAQFGPLKTWKFTERFFPDSPQCYDIRNEEFKSLSGIFVFFFGNNNMNLVHKVALT